MATSNASSNFRALSAAGTNPTKNESATPNLYGSSPLSKFELPSLPDEITQTVRAIVSGCDGHYYAAVPTTTAMEPVHPMGEYVVLQFVNDEALQDGDMVFAWVYLREITPIRRRGKLWRSLHPQTRKDGTRAIMSLRRYGHDAAGNVTLTPDSPGFTSWTAGAHGGELVEIEVVGRAMNRKPWGHHRDGVWC